MMMNRSRSLTLAAVLFVLAFALFSAPRPAFAEVTAHEEFLWELDLFVPCANNGAGEVVRFSGPLHVLFTTTLDNNGGYHATTHLQPMGIGGYGLTTGTRYRATGVTRETFNASVGSNYTFVNNFRMVGQRPGNDWIVQWRTHYTVNANGTLTANFDNFTADCR